ncbi:MAG: polysaccharide deacetylase family protein [Magnetococcales bacterium]|nr:polysaccharide deacetylase family protein [Magnetococcales bacterium]
MSSLLRDIYRSSLVQDIDIPNALFRSLLGNTTAVFLYHQVSESPSPFYSQYDLNVLPWVFERQIDIIGELFHVLTPAEFLEGKFPRPAALITFDDGASGYFHKAVPALRERGVPSINFLNFGWLEGELFWPALVDWLERNHPTFRERLSRHRQGHSMRDCSAPDFLFATPELVETCFKTLGGEAERVMEAVRDYAGPAVAREDLLAVAGETGVFFGNHLYSHYNARMLPNEQLMEEYRRNQARLVQLPHSLDWLGYPFGQAGSCYTEYSHSILKAMGAERLFTSNGGLNRGSRGAWLWDRLVVPPTIETAAAFKWWMLRTRFGQRFTSYQRPKRNAE